MGTHFALNGAQNAGPYRKRYTGEGRAEGDDHKIGGQQQATPYAETAAPGVAVPARQHPGTRHTSATRGAHLRQAVCRLDVQGAGCGVTILYMKHMLTSGYRASMREGLNRWTCQPCCSNGAIIKLPTSHLFTNMDQVPSLIIQSPRAGRRDTLCCLACTSGAVPAERVSTALLCNGAVSPPSHCGCHTLNPLALDVAFGEHLQHLHLQHLSLSLTLPPPRKPSTYC